MYLLSTVFTEFLDNLADFTEFLDTLPTLVHSFGCGPAAVLLAALYTTLFTPIPTHLSSNTAAAVLRARYPCCTQREREKREREGEERESEGEGRESQLVMRREDEERIPRTVTFPRSRRTTSARWCECSLSELCAQIIF